MSKLKKKEKKEVIHCLPTLTTGIQNKQRSHWNPRGISSAGPDILPSHAPGIPNPLALGSASQPCRPCSHFSLLLSLTEPVWTLSLSCKQLTPICTLPPAPLFLATQPSQTPRLPPWWGWGGSHLSHKELTTLPSAVMVQISPWHTPISKELAVTHAPDQKEKNNRSVN